MPKRPLQPQGDFPNAGLLRRFAAIFYDFLLCTALVMVTTLIYKMVQLAIFGEQRLRELSDSGALDGDPVLSSLLLICLFSFFAYFWTRNGQTLGMQVWGIRVQNADGSRISLMQALLRFMVSIASWLCFGFGFFWALTNPKRLTWHDRYSDSQIVRLPKNVYKK